MQLNHEKNLLQRLGLETPDIMESEPPESEYAVLVDEEDEIISQPVEQEFEFEGKDFNEDTPEGPLPIPPLGAQNFH
jgi:hypothetical protein